MSELSTITNTILVSSDEAAKILKLRPATLSQMRWRGDMRIPYVKLGKAVRYKLADIEAFINKNTIG
ncbi:helix-turn-helix domain-containing protein [Aliikangiella sp. IMCC44653]